MSVINSVGSAAPQALQRTSSVLTTSSAAGADRTSATDADSASVSNPAQLMRKLKELASSDPEKFKSVMADVSKQLSSAAESSTDPGEQRMLTDMASKFQKAGETGDLGALRPPAPPHGAPPAGGAPPVGGAKGGGRPGGGGGGGGGGASAASASSSASEVYEAADANQDGKVSEAERQAYEEKQALRSLDAKQAYGAAPEGRAAAFGKTLDRVSSIIEQALSAVG